MYTHRKNSRKIGVGKFPKHSITSWKCFSFGIVYILQVPSLNDYKFIYGENYQIIYQKLIYPFIKAQNWKRNAYRLLNYSLVRENSVQVYSVLPCTSPESLNAFSKAFYFKIYTHSKEAAIFMTVQLVMGKLLPLQHSLDMNEYIVFQKRVFQLNCAHNWRYSPANANATEVS